MMNQNKKSVLLFIALTFFVTWALLAVALAGGLHYGETKLMLVLSGCMFVPAASSLAVRLLRKEGFRDMMLRPHFRGHIRMYAMAWFVPAILMAAGGLLFFSVFPGAFDPNMTALNEQLAAASGLPAANTIVLSQTLLALLAGPLINFIPALGEELGWRGYLLPRLSACMNKRAAILLTGVIWGIWHGPMIAIGHNYGTDYWGYPVLGILLMTVFCVFFGAFLAYITDRTHSAVPAALAHAGLNAIAGLPMLFCKAGYPPTLGPCMMGAISGLPVVIIGILFLRAMKKTPDTAAPDMVNEETAHE